jgi:transcriptional regulator with XRE-family HTH domain
MSEKLRRLQKGAPEDWPSLALLEFTVALARMMKATGDMKQKELADRLGVSPPYISSVMSGNENLTVEQMSRLAEAAGGSLHLTIAPQGLYIRWVEDVLEERTTEVELSPSIHSHAAALSIPMKYPLSAPPLEATRSSAEHMVRASYGKGASHNVSRSAHQLPPAFATRNLGVSLHRRQPVNLLDQSGRLDQ